jgi:uncharacterized protein YutD
MENQNEKLRNACEETADFFRKIADATYSEIQSKLDFVVGSYDFDKNPVGLFEIGQEALEVLKKIKAKSPRKINKQLISNLEESLEK